MLDFQDTISSTVTPFFVAKKSGKLRLVLDCRSANAHFKPPPDVAIPAGYSFSQIELGPRDEMYIAQTDIRDYFYAIGLPVYLRFFLHFPELTLKRFFLNTPFV